MVGEAELIMLEGLAQRPLDRHALHQSDAHSLVEDLDLALARVLGSVHRRVGITENARRRCRVRIGHDDDSDADGDDVLTISDHQEQHDQQQQPNHLFRRQWRRH